MLSSERKDPPFFSVLQAFVLSPSPNGFNISNQHPLTFFKIVQQSVIEQFLRMLSPFDRDNTFGESLVLDGLKTCTVLVLRLISVRYFFLFSIVFSMPFRDRPISFVLWVFFLGRGY